MNRKTKWCHRLLALAMAAMMCCTYFPIGAFAETPPLQESTVVAEEQQTDETETDSGQTDASSPDPGVDTEEASEEFPAEDAESMIEPPAQKVAQEPAEKNEPYTFDGEILYADMPDTPTGSYIGSYGLPVATGETKIGLSAWDADLVQGSYLSVESLDSDNLTLAAPLLEDTDYAIVPILAQVEYPAEGSTLDLVLPDSVTLLDYYGEPAEDAESILHGEYSETSAAVLGVYVQADADFTAQLVYTAPDGSTLKKTLNVTIDRNAAAEYPFPDSEIAAFAERPTPAVTSGKITKVAKVNGTWLIWFNGEPAYCCTHGANGQPAGCPTYTYVNTSTVNADGTYTVINSAAYAANDAMRHTLYYTQRNQGKFILVETNAPAGYFGDWTDIDHPGTAGTPLGKRAYYIEITEANDNAVLWLDNADYNADILTADKGGTKLVTSGGVETTVVIYKASDAPASEIQYKEPARVYNTDNSGKAANEDSYITTATDGVMKNDRTLGEISISKVDLDAVRYVGGKAAHGTAFASGQAHGDATLDGAVYDLYVAEDITHPDGVTGVVDYSKIVDADGNPIWHTTIRDNSGQWVSDYLPVLKKDHLVASAKIEDGWLTFANLYLGKYYVVERSTGAVIPLREGALAVSGTYPTVDSRTKAATGQVAALASSNGQYTDWVYKNQFSTISKSKALDGSWTYDAYSLSFANGYLCDEHNYYITPAYSDEGWYVEKTTFSDNRQAAGEQIDKTSYRANYHLHADNALAESQDQVAKGNVEISKIVSSSGQSNGLELENARFTFYLVSDLSKVSQFDQTRTGAYTLQSILDAYINKSYDNAHLKWDFSGETQAIAKTYEVNAAEIAAYNKTLTAAGENKNGKGDGWQPTGNANEYQLAEIFSSDTGNIRVQGLPYGTYLVVETTTPKDLYQTYGNKPYPIAAVENTKQIEKAIDVMREISPIPVLPKNEVEGCCYDAERQELVFCAAIPPQELLQRLPAEIVMATAESSYAGISENELLRQTAAAISVEVCGRLGLPMPPDAFQTLEGMRDHIPDGEERRTLEKVREMAVTFGDAVCKRLKLERGQPAPQQEER